MDLKSSGAMCSLQNDQALFVIQSSCSRVNMEFGCFHIFQNSDWKKTSQIIDELPYF